MLTFVTRVVGIFSRDDRGRPTWWYAVTLLYMATIVVGQILIWTGSKYL